MPCKLPHPSPGAAEGGNGVAFTHAVCAPCPWAAAGQFVVEERYLAKYHVPALLAVGLEGFWGLILCFVVLPILSVVSATDGLPLDDVPQAFEVRPANLDTIF